MHIEEKRLARSSFDVEAASPIGYIGGYDMLLFLSKRFTLLIIVFNFNLE